MQKNWKDFLLILKIDIIRENRRILKHLRIFKNPWVLFILLVPILVSLMFSIIGLITFLGFPMIAAFSILPLEMGVIAVQIFAMFRLFEDI